jgi:hypothetical protein
MFSQKVLSRKRGYYIVIGRVILFTRRRKSFIVVIVKISESKLWKDYLERPLFTGQVVNITRIANRILSPRV